MTTMIDSFRPARQNHINQHKHTSMHRKSRVFYAAGPKSPPHFRQLIITARGGGKNPSKHHKWTTFAGTIEWRTAGIAIKKK